MRAVKQDAAILTVRLQNVGLEVAPSTVVRTIKQDIMKQMVRYHNVSKLPLLQQDH